nr:hypothetical protein [uncultured Desulfobacter sp.]
MSNTKNAKQEIQTAQKTNTDTYDLDTCTSDPGWAEHARPNDMGPEPDLQRLDSDCQGRAGDRRVMTVP